MSGYPYRYYVPPTEDQHQFFIDETQQSTTGFPQDTFAQGSFDGIPYTMNYLQPTNPTVCNMAPSLSSWTGPSDNPTQNPYLNSSHRQGDYLPLQSQQQLFFNANSYPDYQDAPVYPYDDGQTMCSAAQAFDSLTGTTHQTGPGQPYLGNSGAPPHSEDGRSQSGRSNRSSRTTRGTLNPLAPLGGGMPTKKRRQPCPPNNAKIPGPAVEITYCTLELFSKWLASCEPHKRQATVDALRDPNVRSSYRNPRWNLGAFCRWAHNKESGLEGRVKLKICGQCFHTYGKFYPQRIRVEDEACMCLPVDEARLAAELKLPEEQRLGLGSAKYFPKHRPRFLE